MSAWSSDELHQNVDRPEISGSPWQVRLDVPPDPRFLYVVRLAAAGAAAEAGLTTSEIEDVKVAVDELSSVAMEATTDPLQLRFISSSTGMEVEVLLPPGRDLEIDELGRVILEATVDELVVYGDSQGRGFRVTKCGRGA